MKPYAMKKRILRFILVAAMSGFTSVAYAQDEAARSGAVEAEARSGAEPENQAAADATDWVTELQVKMALLGNLGTDGLKVEVACREGAVSLSGVVGKPEIKELAATLAESIPSVTDVRNEIHLASSLEEPGEASPVVGETDLKDAVLSTRVRLALVEALGSDSFRIGSDVSRGRVTLAFPPDVSAAERAEALSVVREVEGVAEVVSVDQT